MVYCDVLNRLNFDTLVNDSDAVLPPGNLKENKNGSENMSNENTEWVR